MTTEGAAEAARSEAARSEASRLLEQRLRSRRVVELLTGFTAPPIVGLGILVLVFAGVGSDAIIESAAATCTALIVGALLLLVPPVVFALSPEQYIEHQTDIERRIGKLAPGADEERSRPAP